MTINRSQGQTFKAVGVELSDESFTHKMLYVALSRVGSPDFLTQLVREDHKTRNVVYSVLPIYCYRCCWYCGVSSCGCVSCINIPLYLLHVPSYLSVVFFFTETTISVALKIMLLITIDNYWCCDDPHFVYSVLSRDNPYYIIPMYWKLIVLWWSAVHQNLCGLYYDDIMLLNATRWIWAPSQPRNTNLFCNVVIELFVH